MTLKVISAVRNHCEFNMVEMQYLLTLFVIISEYISYHDKNEGKGHGWSHVLYTSANISETVRDSNVVAMVSYRSDMRRPTVE